LQDDKPSDDKGAVASDADGPAADQGAVASDADEPGTDKGAKVHEADHTHGFKEDPSTAQHVSQSHTGTQSRPLQSAVTPSQTLSILAVHWQF
jgi:hypothetical protein